MSSAPALLGPADVRQLARTHGVRPTKSLGQNFVTDANTVRRIVRLAGLSGAETVLEVGPGLGSLTLALLPSAAHVVAVEVDPVLAGVLTETVRARAPDYASRLTVVAEDALRVADLPVQPDVLVANLPYNVAVPVVLHLLERFTSIARGLVMVQSEVADRLVARPGSRTYGVPSVKLAWYADARRAGDVPRSVFWPVPNVDSALVTFTRHDLPATDVSRAEVFAVVEAGFAQRRKTLRGALAALAAGPARAEEALRSAGVDPAVRGESLDVAAFVRIARSLK